MLGVSGNAGNSIVDVTHSRMAPASADVSMTSSRMALPGIAGAIKRAYSSTDLLQTFYRPECRRTSEPESVMQWPAGVSATDAEAGCATDVGLRQNPAALFDQIDACIAALRQHSQQGLQCRLWRDGISLAVCVVLMGLMGRALGQRNDTEHDDFSALNHLTDNVYLDASTIVLEWCKSLVTSSLSYPTLRRHHLVDERIRRMSACTLLLDAALALPPAAGRARGCRYQVVRYAEKARSAATVFTLFNTALPLLRGGLWALEQLGQGSTFACWRGLARLAQSGSDSLRAMCSGLGTIARDRLFHLELEQLQSRLNQCRSQCQNVADNLTEHVTDLPLHTNLGWLLSACSTPLLSRIAAQMSASSPLLAALSSRTIDSPQEWCRLLEEHQIPVFLADHNYLHCQEPEDAWGRRGAAATGYRWSAATMLRLPYRLTLELQHQLSRPVEALLKRAGTP